MTEKKHNLHFEEKKEELKLVVADKYDFECQVMSKVTAYFVNFGLSGFRFQKSQ